MSKQRFYEDVDIGSEIPQLVKQPTTRQIVQWCGATGDYYEIHYDKDFALSQGLPGPIVNGLLIAAFLGQLMTDWIGDDGSLKKLSCSYRGMLLPGEDVFCRGRVTKKYIQNGEHYLESEIWAENQKGEKMAPGTALVTLPSRHSDDLELDATY